MNGKRRQSGESVDSREQMTAIIILSASNRSLVIEIWCVNNSKNFRIYFQEIRLVGVGVRGATTTHLADADKTGQEDRLKTA